jgi:hypothetical protein
MLAAESGVTTIRGRSICSRAPETADARVTGRPDEAQPDAMTMASSSRLAKPMLRNHWHQGAYEYLERGAARCNGKSIELR